jgi:hypothetical protein
MEQNARKLEQRDLVSDERKQQMQEEKQFKRNDNTAAAGAKRAPTPATSAQPKKKPKMERDSRMPSLMAFMKPKK